MNMSYCKFQNTLKDLQDCYQSMDEGEAEDMSQDEQSAKEQLIALCTDIAYENKS